jgi:hypothetical protein
MKFLNKFNSLNSLLYFLIFYQLFKTILVLDNFMVSDYRIGSFKEKNILKYEPVEKKILLDLRYKAELDLYKSDVAEVTSLLVNQEQKIIGYRIFYSRGKTAEKLPFLYSKKLLYSTIFGSIKLIKL